MAADDPKLRRIADNRKARFEYEVLEELECGVELTGTEVKSLRQGQCSLQEAFGLIKHHQLWLVQATIPEYTQGNVHNHDPDRERKLLMHRREIESLYGKVRERGLTLVPTRMYFQNGHVKVAISLAKGKKAHDKRETIKRREADRETRAAVKERRR